MPWVRVEGATKVAIRVALAQAEAEGADVHIPRGVYDIDLTDEPPDTVGGPAIDVPPGVRRIFGDGADETVLRFRRAPTAGYAQWSGLRILGPICAIEDLTLEGPDEINGGVGEDAYTPDEETRAITVASKAWDDPPGTLGGTELTLRRVQTRGRWWQFLNGGQTVEVHGCDFAHYGTGLSGPGPQGSFSAYYTTFHGPEYCQAHVHGIYSNPDDTLHFEQCRFLGSGAGYAIKHYGQSGQVGSRGLTVLDCVFGPRVTHAILGMRTVIRVEDTQFLHRCLAVPEAQRDIPRAIVAMNADVVARRCRFSNPGASVFPIDSEGCSVHLEECTWPADSHPYPLEPRGAGSSWTVRGCHLGTTRPKRLINADQTEDLDLRVEDTEFSGVELTVGVYAVRGRIALRNIRAHAPVELARIGGTARLV